MARQLAKIDLVYVDMGKDTFQDPTKFYPVKLANNVPGGGNAIKDKLCDVYLTAFYCHNLPDWDKVNEAMLKFGIKYMPQQLGGPTAEQEATFALDFRVYDASAPGGFLHRRIFRNVKWADEVVLSIKLDEVDKKYDIAPIVKVLSKTSISEVLDLAGYTQYIELGSQIYNMVADIALMNDPIWDEPNTVLRYNFVGGGGAAALRQGTYCLVATTDTKGNDLRKWDSSYKDVYYKGKHLHLGQAEDHLKTNYLVFSFSFH